MDNVLTLTVRSTHFFLLDCKGGKLLIDAGWELAQFTSQMKAYKLPFSDIRYVLFTHHHPDHAGLVQDIKDLSGAKLIIHAGQISYLKDLLAYFEKKGGYNPIRVEKEDLISPDRAALQAIGIRGEILQTPGHSDDSISLALDNGIAFIGDLPHPDFAVPEAHDLVCASWKNLIARGAHTFYHSHTDPIPLSQVRIDASCV
jgi:endoribonuclease LACTB2